MALGPLEEAGNLRLQSDESCHARNWEWAARLVNHGGLSTPRPHGGAINPELPGAASPPPAWSQPAAAKKTAHKGRRAETGAQNPKGAWPPGRPSARPARWASPHLLSCVLADTDHSPADRAPLSL